MLINKSLVINEQIQNVYIVPAGLETIILSIIGTDLSNIYKNIFIKVYDRFNIEKTTYVLNNDSNKTSTLDSKIILNEYETIRAFTDNGICSLSLNLSEEISSSIILPPSTWGFRGTYENKEYDINQIVSYEGSLYISNSDVPIDNPPTNSSYWSLFLEKSVPYIEPGMVVIFPADLTIDGYLKCNGTELSRITYSNLFNKIGTIYGEGDGFSTFNIPDYRGMFLRGLDEDKGIDSNRLLGTIQMDEFKSHFHGLRQRPPWLTAERGGSSEIWAPGWATRRAISWNTNNTGGTETRPINMSVIFYIKY